MRTASDSTRGRIAIVGSGIAGTTIAYHLVRKGFTVDIFEKGPAYPYPHTEQFHENVTMLQGVPLYERPPADLKAHTFNGTWSRDLETERYMQVGGGASMWEAIALRMRPNDFARRTRFGYGDDWPLTYEELELFYGRAERLLGVSGTDADNPFAPPRSAPYPLPPFELSYDDEILAERLRQAGIVLHTTPQARTRQSYNDRNACTNFASCRFCPIGARYSPNYHLEKALKTGRCQVLPNVSVRRVLTDASGRASGVVYRANDGASDIEHPATAVILAAGTLETVRLLLLSKDSRNPDGLGNRSGHVGQHFTLHHIWHGGCNYSERLLPGRFGGWTGQSEQFVDPAPGAGHAGIKVEFPSRPQDQTTSSHEWRLASDILEDMASIPYTRPIIMHSESTGSGRKLITLSEEADRFGDPFAHVEYWHTPLDHETFKYARDLAEKFATATRADEFWFEEKQEAFTTAYHHMGATRMARSAKDGVVDSFGEVFDVPGLFLAGNGIFVGASGAANPTLTTVALAIRTGEYLANRL